MRVVVSCMELWHDAPISAGRAHKKATSCAAPKGRLREALGYSAETSRLIESIPSRGYRFIV